MLARSVIVLSLLSVACGMGRDHINTEKPIDKKQSEQLTQQEAELEKAKQRDAEIGTKVDENAKSATTADQQLKAEAEQAEAQRILADKDQEAKRVQLEQTFTAVTANMNQVIAANKIASEKADRNLAVRAGRTELTLFAQKKALASLKEEMTASFAAVRTEMAQGDQVVQDMINAKEAALAARIDAQEKKVGEVEGTVQSLAAADKSLESKLQSLESTSKEAAGKTSEAIEGLKTGVSQVSQNINSIHAAIGDQIAEGHAKKLGQKASELEGLVASMDQASTPEVLKFFAISAAKTARTYANDAVVEAKAWTPVVNAEDAIAK